MRFLHAGCGQAFKAKSTPYFASDEWEEVRFDIDPAVQPDILGSITDLEAIADASYDAVFSSHNIEHLYPHEVQKALQSFRRVLKQDGHLVIVCPDIQAAGAYIAAGKLLETLYVSPAGPITPLDMLYGLRSSIAANNTHMAHRCGFVRQSLSNELLMAGFAMVWATRFTEMFSLAAIALVSPVEEDELMRLVVKHFPQKKAGATV